MTPAEEASLIEQFSQPARQRKAFEQVVRQYSPQLYRQIRRMVYSHEDANDILQNTFIKAWTNLEQFRGESKLSTWLYRIAVNEALNFLQRRKDTTAIDEAPAAVVGRLRADAYFDGDEAELQLQEAIAGLPEKQRAVFLLKYYEDMKYEDMSRVMDTSVGALKASYHHAVKKICDFLNRGIKPFISTAIKPIKKRPT